MANQIKFSFYISNRLRRINKSSDFYFHCINILHYKCLKVNLNHARSDIYFPNWMKKATISPINDHDKCLQYAGTIASNHEEIGKKMQ